MSLMRPTREELFCRDLEALLIRHRISQVGTSIMTSFLFESMKLLNDAACEEVCNTLDELKPETNVK